MCPLFMLNSLYPIKLKLMAKEGKTVNKIANKYIAKVLYYTVTKCKMISHTNNILAGTHY